MERFLFHLKSRGLRQTLGLSLSHLSRGRLAFASRLFRRKSQVTNDDILLSLCILQKEIRDLKDKLDQLNEGR